MDNAAEKETISIEENICNVTKKDMLNDTIIALENLINNKMDEKRAILLLNWLNNFFNYIDWEITFDPTRIRSYKRGEIVFANFGFNVGSEIGGLRFAIVIENNNNSSDGNVVVAPLTTFGKDEKLSETPHGCIYIGEIKGLKSKNNYVKVNQLKPISKLRIYKPKKKTDTAFKVTNDVLDSIDELIKKLFTKTKNV